MPRRPESVAEIVDGLKTLKLHRCVGRVSDRSMQCAVIRNAYENRYARAHWRIGGVTQPWPRFYLGEVKSTGFGNVPDDKSTVLRRSSDVAKVQFFGRAYRLPRSHINPKRRQIHRSRISKRTVRPFDFSMAYQMSMLTADEQNFFVGCSAKRREPAASGSDGRELPD